MKKKGKIIPIAFLILGMLCIASGLIFLLQDGKSSKEEQGAYHSYTCTTEPTSYTGPMNQTEYITSYVEKAKYHFIEFDSQLVTAEYSQSYQFKTKKDYDQFILGRSKVESIQEVLNEKDLKIEYSGYMIFPNMEDENPMKFTEGYLTQLKKEGFSCQLDEKE